MEVQLFHDAGLGNGSYLVEVGSGRAVLIDPDRRVRRYLDAARDRSLEIVGVFDTHLHADFVSGAQDLGPRPAPICTSPPRRACRSRTRR